jgi:hypothetical protein
LAPKGARKEVTRGIVESDLDWVERRRPPALTPSGFTTLFSHSPRTGPGSARRVYLGAIWLSGLVFTCVPVGKPSGVKRCKIT